MGGAPRGPHQWELPAWLRTRQPTAAGPAWTGPPSLGPLETSAAPESPAPAPAAHPRPLSAATALGAPSIAAGCACFPRKVSGDLVSVLEGTVVAALEDTLSSWTPPAPTLQNLGQSRPHRGTLDRPLWAYKHLLLRTSPDSWNCQALAPVPGVLRWVSCSSLRARWRDLAVRGKQVQLPGNSAAMCHVPLGFPGDRTWGLEQTRPGCHLPRPVGRAPWGAPAGSPVRPLRPGKTSWCPTGRARGRAQTCSRRRTAAGDLSAQVSPVVPRPACSRGRALAHGKPRRPAAPTQGPLPVRRSQGDRRMASWQRRRSVDLWFSTSSGRAWSTARMSTSSLLFLRPSETRPALRSDPRP